LLAAALRAGSAVHSSDKSITQSGRVFPRGTLIFKVKESFDTIRNLVAIGTRTGAEAVATNTGWVEDGVNFGSRFVTAMKAPTMPSPGTRRLPPVRPVTRFVIERQFGYPTVPVRTSALGGGRPEQV
jgi:hypothetical protein